MHFLPFVTFLVTAFGTMGIGRIHKIKTPFAFYLFFFWTVLMLEEMEFAAFTAKIDIAVQKAGCPLLGIAEKTGVSSKLKWRPFYEFKHFSASCTFYFFIHKNQLLLYL